MENHIEIAKQDVRPLNMHILFVGAPKPPSRNRREAIAALTAAHSKKNSLMRRIRLPVTVKMSE
jgi:hypothetical protein